MRSRIAIMASALFGAFGLLCMVGLATPAFADNCTAGCAVNATVQVPSTVSLNGLGNSVAFPETPAGSVATAALSFNVSSNDGGGYQVTLAPGASAFHDTASYTIPNTFLSVATTVNGQPSPAGTITGADWNGTTPELVYGTGVASGGSDNFAQTWNLQIPGGQFSALYSESFTFFATGN